MTIWLLLLALYSVGTSVLVFVAYRRMSAKTFLDEQLKGIPFQNLPPAERVSAIREVVKLREQETAWFERSLSGLGVVAFFSMLIATGVQTFKSSIEAAQSSQLTQQVESLRKERTASEVLLSDLSKSVMAQYREADRLDSSGLEILKHRLRVLQGTPGLTKDGILEEFELALLLKDYDAAREALDRNIDLLDRSKPRDLIDLAEYFFMNRAFNSAQEALQAVEPKFESLPRAWKIRVICLQAQLDGDVDKHAQRLAAVMNTSLEQARFRLQSEQAKAKTIPSSPAR